MNSAFDTHSRYIDRAVYVGSYLNPYVRNTQTNEESAYDFGEVRESRLVFAPQLASNTVLVVGHDVGQTVHVTFNHDLGAGGRKHRSFPLR